jgi:hypothetical protein
MGNVNCICTNSISKGINFEQDSIMAHKSNSIILIQTFWKGFKTRRDYKKRNFNFSKFPGIILQDSQITILTTLPIQQIEQKLGALKCDIRKYPSYISLSSGLKDRSIYIGTFNRRWQKQGFGVLYHEDGSKYTGFLKNDYMNGYGRIIYPEGEYYEGEFRNSKFNNFGVYGNLKGVIYKGQWKNGERNGMGEEYRDDGSHYTGEFENNNKKGKGKYKWADGDVYEGMLINNEIEGIGKMVFADGKIYIGEWKDNKMNGRGVFIWPDGRKYIGNYKSDKKNGVGMLIWPNSRRFEGDFLNGKQHGCGIYYLNENTQFGEWRIGKRLRWIELNEATKNNFEHINQEIFEIIEYLKAKGINPFVLY